MHGVSPRKVDGRFISQVRTGGQCGFCCHVLPVAFVDGRQRAGLPIIDCLFNPGTAGPAFWPEPAVGEWK